MSRFPPYAHHPHGLPPFTELFSGICTTAAAPVGSRFCTTPLREHLPKLPHALQRGWVSPHRSA